MKSHFWPFTAVQPEIWNEVTRKMASPGRDHGSPAFAQREYDRLKGYGGQAADITDHFLNRGKEAKVCRNSDQVGTNLCFLRYLLLKKEAIRRTSIRLQGNLGSAISIRVISIIRG